MKIKKASNFFFFILRLFFIPFLFFKYRLRFDRSVSKKIKSPCIIVANHVTVLDPFIIGSGFKFAMNFVANESLIKKSLSGNLIRMLCHPIPIKKGVADATAVKSIMGIIKKGGSVAIFPEGNASFFGETGNIRPTLGKLVKKLNVPVVIVEMCGGYNTAPRWKNKRVNKGKMHVYVKSVLDPAELAEMSDYEVNTKITDLLYYNEFQYNIEKKIAFKGNHKAEDIETALFACLSCHSLIDFKSSGNEFYCASCGARVKINDFGLLEKLSNAELFPETILEYSKMQIEIVKKIDFSAFSEIPVFFDKNISIFKYKRKDRDFLLRRGTVSFYNNRIEVEDLHIHFDELEGITLNKMHRLQLYFRNGDSYAVVASEKVNLIKYMICYYQIVNAEKECEYYGY